MRERARAGRLQRGGLQQRRLVVVREAVAGVLARVLARLAQRLMSTQGCWAYRLLLLQSWCGCLVKPAPLMRA